MDHFPHLFLIWFPFLDPSCVLICGAAFAGVAGVAWFMPATSAKQVAVVVGGIAEMFMVSKTKENIYLKKRKNFTKIAIEVSAL